MSERFVDRARSAVRRRIVAWVAQHAEQLKVWLKRVESFQERCWEYLRYGLQRLPSDGEMTAILRRNGWPSFYQFIVRQRRGQFGRRKFVPGDRDGCAQSMRDRFPEECDRIVARAERLLQGEFNLLGSGPVDMRRGKSGPGHRIDWNRDLISGETYPKVFSQWRWNPFKMRRGNADVKGPWELSRCQHFTLLGQAYWLTGDERFAECYARTIDDFIRRNPAGNGVHWACTMDVALRTVSWLAGLSFFQGSRALNDFWWRRFLKSLVQHGRHITNNLEFGTLDGKIIVSNHGLANLFGLYWLGINFPGLDAGCVWRGIAETGLEQQVRMQILEDGGGFESSVPYHRLVTEMFLSAHALAQHHRLSFSEEYRGKLVSALRFVRGLRQDGGRLPQVGDADNGRAHIFSRYGVWEDEQENMDHLLVAGATVLGITDFLHGVEPKYRIEECFWRDLGDPMPQECGMDPIPSAALFGNAGIAVLRQGLAYVMMSNSECGTFGIGNHKHNDQLAIEWAIGNQPILVDAGSYTYTQDPEARNLFRSTATHNTVQLAGDEQNGLDPAALFRLVQRGVPDWDQPAEAGDGTVGIRGRHSAYEQLSGSPTHERRIMMRVDGTLIIDDWFENAGEHRQRWNFLVHPSVSAKATKNVALLAWGDATATIQAPEGVVWSIVPVWYSRCYGVRERAVSLVVELQSQPRATFVAGLAGMAVPVSQREAQNQSDALWRGVEFKKGNIWKLPK